MRLLFFILLFPFFTKAQTVQINGTGRTITLNAPGQPSSVGITVPIPPISGRVYLSASSGVSKASNVGSFTDFDLVSMSGYTKVKIAGTVDRVRFNLTLLPTGTFTDYYIRVWRKDGATYDLVGEVQIPKANLVSGINEHVNSSPFAVQVGDYVGMAMDGQSTNSNLKVSIGANGSGRYNLTYPNGTTDQNWDGATTTTVYWKVQLIEDDKEYTPGKRGVAIGNSTVGDYYTSSTVGTAVSDLLLTDAELEAGYQLHSIATPNETIAQQRTAWNALVDHSVYDYVIVQIGLNDMNPAESAATALARYQTLIDDIRADAPDITIIAAKMIPAKARWNTIWPGDPAGAQQKWVDMNDAMMGTGANAITGIDDYIDAHVPLLDDGAGNLAAAYDVGDGIHPNDAGRTIIANAWRAKLEELNFLP